MLNLVGRKHRSKLANGSTSALLNESAAAPASSFARRQLEKLGWKDGEGLGKNRDGISTHIRAVKRQDEVGLGADETRAAITSAKDAAALAGADDWWKNSLGDTLARLQQRKKDKKKKSKKKKKKSKSDGCSSGSDDSTSSDEANNKINDNNKRKRHYTDEELFEATGGARFGMRQGKRQHGKWQRTESGLSQEEEEKVKAQTEWDGISAPKIILTSNNTNKAPSSSSVVISNTNGNSNNSSPSSSDIEETVEKDKQKKDTKKSKNDKKKFIPLVSMSDVDETDKKSKKEKKKEKKSKKDKKSSKKREKKD